ncbi:MAG: alpha/beta hydrolase [Synechococcaceae cyanobacterium]|nr:alpha/beta hydrolase [Synechococcaceae cyanobacterium]
MTIRAAIREQQRRERVDLRLALLLLGLALLAGLLLWQPSRGLLLQLLSPADVQLLLLWIGAALLLLIPIAGIISLVSQFAYWEGWLAGLPAAGELFAAPAQAGADPSAGPAAGTTAPQRFVIYLDGIHQFERDHPPRVSALLDALDARLPQGWQLLRGLETYTVMPEALVDDSGGSWFWRRLFALQEQHPSALVQLLAAVLVQANNVIKVGISSDRRYGPIRHYELALKLGLRLAELGFVPGEGELLLLGYSGGAEMAFGVSDYLTRLCRTPVRIISVCGVFSGNHPLDRLSGIATVVGSRDPVAAFGNIAYPGRSPLLPGSRWRRALAAGSVRRRSIEGMNHNGASGPFSNAYRPRVVEAVVALL